MLEEFFKNQKITPKKIKKNTILQMQGSIATKSFYVKSGLLRSYTIDDNGKVHIFMFAPEGWMISDIESRSMSVPTELFIDALEDSEIIEINQAAEYVRKLINTGDVKIVEKLFRRIAVLQRRVLLLMSATAKERYQHFLDTYPQLVNRVPLKMIASYLGITPEALSNIRSRMKKQEN